MSKVKDAVKSIYNEEGREIEKPKQCPFCGVVPIPAKLVQSGGEGDWFLIHNAGCYLGAGARTLTPEWIPKWNVRYETKEKEVSAKHT